MTTHYYCTPNWLQESKEIYNSNPQAKEKLKKVSAKMAYRVKAEPSWGINKDVYFCAYFESGELNKLELVTKEAAFDILGAKTPIRNSLAISALRKGTACCTEDGLEIKLSKAQLHIYLRPPE